MSVIPCQHIREYPHALKAEQGILQLAIKEYRPLTNRAPSDDSITIIATHANGLPKETYEPLWDDLYKAFDLKIRAIWIADSSHQGASGVLKESLQGDDPSWFDHSRDLLSMVNHFRERMPQPIVGIAHSMGAAQIVQLSLIHPRLFCGLALIEPVIQRDSPSGPNAALPTSYRPDLWSSRSKAERSFRNNPFFKVWQPRVLDKYLQYGLRDTPTALYDSSSEATPGAVTLTTTKHQEAWSYVRSNFAPKSLDPNDPTQRLLSPDLDPTNEGAYLFHRAESILALQGLPHLRPSVLWVFGSQSPINTPELQDEKMALSGTGLGGNGGVITGRVERVIIQDAAHMVPFEKVEDCAVALADWLKKQMGEFKAAKKFHEEFERGKSERDMLAVSKQWLKGVRQKSDTKRPLKGKL